MSCNCRKRRTRKPQSKSYTALNAAADVVKNALGIGDDPFAPSDIVQSRLETCLECEKLVRATKQCRMCGCFVVAKTKMAQSSCPLGKWGTRTP